MIRGRVVADAASEQNKGGGLVFDLVEEVEDPSDDVDMDAAASRPPPTWQPPMASKNGLSKQFWYKSYPFLRD